MPGYTHLNVKRDVEDMAPKFGYSPELESRFARVPLELENSGLSYFKVAPGYRMPFGHRHSEQEEVYLVISGSARVKVGDDVVELGRWDALRVSRGEWRGLEAGTEGAEVLAFGAPNTDNKDIDMQPGWWED
jgi:mannose-6-phosphate isomerase-like protein (cupin superfamily)